MKFRITALLFLILCTSIWCSAQKIKIQDDQVLLDGKPVLKIQMVEHDKLKTWVVLKLTGDTAITFVEKRIELKLLPHEQTGRKYDYYEVRFSDSDKAGYMDHYSFNTARNIAEMLRDCFADGIYPGGCADKVMEKYCDWSANKMEAIQGANKWRDSLLNDAAYLKYSANLPRRSAQVALEIQPDSTLMVFDVKIGRYHVLDKGSFAITYRVMTQKNKPLASISYKYGRKSIFIRTFNDNVGKEYFLDHQLNRNDIYDAIAYLVDYGYL